jgi:hypothetical protein
MVQEGLGGAGYVPRPERTFETWLAEGRRKGWITGPVCATHEGIPATEDEEAAWEEGHDPCHHVLRLWSEGERPAPRWDL